MSRPIECFAETTEGEYGGDAEALGTLVGLLSSDDVAEGCRQLRA